MQRSSSTPGPGPILASRYVWPVWEPTSTANRCGTVSSPYWPRSGPSILATPVWPVWGRVHVTTEGRRIRRRECGWWAWGRCATPLPSPGGRVAWTFFGRGEPLNASGAKLGPMPPARQESCLRVKSERVVQCCGPGRQAKPLGRQRPLRNEGRPAPRVEARETFLVENDRVESRRSPEDGAGRVRGRAQLRRGSAGRLRGQDNTRPPSASPVLREPSRTKLGRRSPVVENAGGGIGDGSARRGVRGGRRGEHRLLGRSARSELSRALARGSVVGHRGPRDHTAHRPHVRRGVDHGSFSDRSEKPSSPGTPGDGEIELRYFWPAQVIPAHAGGWQFHSCGTPGGSIIPRAHGAARFCP